MAGSLYDVLRVAPDTGVEELAAAYRRRRARFRDPATGSEARLREIDAAWLVLGDPHHRRAYDETMGRCPLCGATAGNGDALLAHLVGHVEDAEMGEPCRRCGRSPAKRFVFRWNQGMLVRRRVTVVREQLCRVCATGVFRDCQVRNLTRGPWGIISAMSTPVYLAMNLDEYRRGIGRLDPPVPPDPVEDPAREGRPILLRPAILLTVTVASAIVWAALRF